MFNFNKTEQAVALDKAIDDLIEELHSMEGSNEDYSATADNFIKLMKLKREAFPSWRPSPDAVVSALGSIAGILVIVRYEQIGNIITSKALGFVGKMLK